MKLRQILIVAGVAIAAFAAALAISGAGADGEPKAKATPAKPAEVIDLEQATVSASVTAPAGLPKLRVPKPKKKAEPPATSGTTVSPQAQNPTPEQNTTTTPQATAPQATAPPAATAQPQPKDDIITGGGEINVAGGED
jgi:hypothetical protein